MEFVSWGEAPVVEAAAVGVAAVEAAGLGVEHGVVVEGQSIRRTRTYLGVAAEVGEGVESQPPLRKPVEATPAHLEEGLRVWLGLG